MAFTISHHHPRSVALRQTYISGFYGRTGLYKTCAHGRGIEVGQEPGGLVEAVWRGVCLSDLEESRPAAAGLLKGAVESAEVLVKISGPMQRQ